MHHHQPHFKRIDRDLHLIPSEQTEFLYSTPARTFQEFMTNLLNRFPVPMDAAPFHAVAHMYRTLYFHSRFRRDGSRVFRVSEGVAGLLRHTNVDNIPCEWVRLPFSSLYLQLPDSPALFTVAGQDRHGHPHHYQGIGIYCVESEAGGVRSLHLHMTGIHLDDPDDDQTMNVELKMQEGLSMEQVFAATAMSGHYLEPWADIAKIREDLWHGVRLAINLLLYVADPSAELSEPIKGSATLKLEKHPKKAEEWKRQMRRIASKEPIIIDVGKSVRPVREFSQELGSPYELSVRYVVRGHWRQQPCGPGGKDRKLAWIAPYWKGPEWAEVMQKDYLVINSRSDPQPLG
jgi:hypothetical protein